MAEHTFDRLAKAWGAGISRRRMLRLAGASVGALATAQLVSRTSRADDGCQVADDCDSGMVCEGGFCLYPACYPAGSECSNHDECCDDNLCLEGMCGASQRCGLETESCGNDGDCCPGMVCAGGVCTIPEPEPEENNGSENGSSDGGGQSGGGNSGGHTGDPDSPTGGGGESNYSPNQPAATTSTGVSVSSLPSTGTGREREQQHRFGMTAVAAAGIAAVAAKRTMRATDERTDNSHS